MAELGTFRGLLLTIAAVFAAPALACTPYVMPPHLPGESDAAYSARLEQEASRNELNWEASSFDNTAQVFLGRIEGNSSVVTWRDKRGIPQIRIFPLSEKHISVRPLQWFRGKPQRSPFLVIATGGMCGGTAVGDLIEATPGEVQMFFAEAGKLGPKLYLFSLSRSKARDPQIVAAFDRFDPKR